MRGLRSKSWSPYAVGVGIGVLSWFAFATADHGLGITTSFEHTAALVEGGLAPSVKAANPYWGEHAPKIDWEWMLVIGVFAGSFLSSKSPAIDATRSCLRCGGSASARPSRSGWPSPSPAAP